MAHVFISFLGIGNFNKTPGYDRAEYAWTEKTPHTITCCFAQTAILAALEASDKSKRYRGPGGSVLHPGIL